MNNKNHIYFSLAAFLHDMGKFSERSGKFDIKGEEITKIEDSQVYQPKYHNRFTHKHTNYTAKTIEKLSEYSVLPKELNKLSLVVNGKNYDFIALAARHHKPENVLEKIIQQADRLSSGFERQEYEDYNNEIKVKDYKKARLYSLFENIGSNNSTNFTYVYKKLNFNTESIFPETSQNNIEFSSEDYKQHFQNFINELDNLKHKDNINIWIENFNSLYMLYTSNIPSFTVGTKPPLVSLYDHSKTTAAIANALFNYFIEKKDINNIDLEKVEEIIENEKTLMFISGNFYGIQDFIFSEGGEISKKLAKILRGRSFYVSLLTEIFATHICQKLNLTNFSIIINAAGKFLILSHNTENAEKKIKEIETEISDWLYNNFNNEISFGIATYSYKATDLQTNKIKDIFKNLSDLVEDKKFNKFNIFKYSGVVNNSPQSYNELCKFCVKRKTKNNSTNICRICEDHIEIGESLLKKDRFIIYDIDKINGGLSTAILGKYQIKFVDENEQQNNQEERFKIKEYYISYEKDFSGIANKFINGYAHKEENSQEISDFGKLAEDENVDMIGVFKADIDNLGTIFKNISNYNISYYSNLSRQLDLFFTFFLPRYLNKNKGEIYTLFAGGDDLFLIGNWKEIIKTSIEIRNKFKKYVCENKNISISGSINFFKPKEPVKFIRLYSEEGLEESKKFKGKDAITLFLKTVKWENFTELMKIKDYIKENNFSKSYIYKLNHINELKEKEEKMESFNKFSISDLNSLKWRAYLYYYTVRNIKENYKYKLEKLLNYFESYKSNMRIPLWLSLYETRKK